ncbi:hypothetical protein AC1031_014715 [Aphanomyces cochlioides]|nr:hypothetical protein AC1031_014715 [Aphanomyces cochlioides]
MRVVAGNAKERDDLRELSEDDEPRGDLARQKSRIGARCHSGNGTRVSVRDQIAELNTTCLKHHEILREMEERHKQDKALLLRMMDELDKKLAHEMQVAQTDHDKKLKAANDEIERLSKCLNVQRGTVATLQEQCVSLHKHIVTVEEDVQTLATEVLGD